jgi:hypothetical protein
MIQSSKSFTIEQWVATDKFRDGWDCIFGNKEITDADSASNECVPCSDQTILVDTEHCTNDLVGRECSGCIIRSGNESRRDGDQAK